MYKVQPNVLQKANELSNDILSSQQSRELMITSLRDTD